MTTSTRAPECAPAHQALLYGGTGEFVDAVLPFVRDGLRAGEEVLVASSAEHIAVLHEHLHPHESAAVSFEDSSHRDGPAVRALGDARQHWHVLLHRGRRVRAVVDQPLGPLPDEGLELCRSDTALNNLWGLAGVSVLCTFDRRRLGPALTQAVRRCHPEMIEHGASRACAAYTDPRTVLSEGRHGSPLALAPEGAARLVCPEDPAEVRAFVGGTAAGLGVAEPRLSDFVMATHEVVANAMTNAAIDMVTVWSGRDSRSERVVCEVRDDGDGLPDPLAGYRPPDLDATSGRGLWLARQLTDLVQVRTGPAGSTVRVHVAAEPAGQPA